MEIRRLIEIALADADGRRVQVTGIEPARVEARSGSALSQLVAELVNNGIAFSSPGQRVTIAGVFDGDHYLISISDNGPGISEQMLAALNRLLDDHHSGEPEATLGLPLVARLAARVGVAVRLIPGVPGITARVTIPPSLVSEAAITRTTPRAEPEQQETAVTSTIDLGVFESEVSAPIVRHVVPMPDSARQDAEGFLERVFGPLRGSSARRERPPAQPTAPRTGPDQPAPSRPFTDHEPRGGTAGLRVRVPGENFSFDTDEESVLSSEAAIDLKMALSRYDEGRQKAEDADR